MRSLDIALKGIKAVFIYNMLREAVPKSNGTWEKRIQVVITSGVRDKVRQGMLLSSNCVYRNEIFICDIPTRLFAVLYIMHSLGVCHIQTRSVGDAVSCAAISIHTY